MRAWSKGEEPPDMKDLGKGLGTCGIWLGVGMIGWNMPAAAILPSFAACMATLFIWLDSQEK